MAPATCRRFLGSRRTVSARKSLQLWIGRESCRGFCREEKLRRTVHGQGFLGSNAYISLESALTEWGISTQSPAALTCVTTGFPRRFRSASVRIIYRHISRNLYWGFQTKRMRYGSYGIAEPEKALLDWVSLQGQEGLPMTLDELSLNAIDKKKLRKYALKYPHSVQRTIEE